MPGAPMNAASKVVSRATTDTLRILRTTLVHGIPVEVLNIIFEHTAQFEPEPHTHWLPVSQVCRRWRNIALDSPRIWGQIYVPTNLHLVELFLERSKGSALSIHSIHGGATEEEVALLLRQSYRLKEINFRVCEPEFLPMFCDLQFPILESLVLDARWYSPVAHFPFAPEIDTGVVPPLRHVKLSLCSFDVNIPFLSHLRSLVIHHQATALVLPMHEVLSALTMMKHLESLELVSILGFFKIHDIPRHFLVELPELRVLRLVSENPLVLTMLQHLSCPSLLSVVVTSGPPLHGGVPSSALAAEISTGFYSLIPGSPFSWQIKANITLHRWSSVHTVSILPSSTSPPSTLELKGRTDDAIAMMLPTYHGQPGRLTFLRALDVTLVNQDRWQTVDVGVLRSFLWTLDVEELRINDVEVLTAIISDAPADPHPGIILPSLKHLDIEHLGRLTYSRRKLGKLKRALASRSPVKNGVLEVLRFRHPLGEDSLVKFRSVAQKLEYIDASQASQEL